MKEAKDWAGLLALLGITALAAFLRFDELGLKPFHHDEGVNAWFVNEIIEKFKYRYNPRYYHGPFLYYMTAPFVLLFGKTPEAIRYAPALLGTLTIPALAIFKPRLGWLGVLGTGLLMAIAPIDVYFSKTAIHEIYNSTFNLLLVAGFYMYWRTAKKSALFLAFISTALLFATKETTVITLAALVPAIILTWYFAKGKRTFPGGKPVPPALLAAAPAWWRKAQVPEGTDPSSSKELWPETGAPEAVVGAGETLKAAIEAARDAARQVEKRQEEARLAAVAAGVQPPPRLPRSFTDLATPGWVVNRIPIVSFVVTFLTEVWSRDSKAFKVALGLFVATLVLFFSSFFTYKEGIPGFFEAFVGWGETGVEGKGHEKIWSYFIDDVLMVYYQPLIFIALPALVVGAYFRDAFSIFNLVWFALTLAVYSAIPYKTPWCVLSFITPLFFGIGIAINGLVVWAKGFSQGPLRYGLIAIPLLLSSPGIYGYYQQSLTLQYDEYDVDFHSIIYVQNVREYMDLVVDLRGILTALNTGDERPELYMVKAHNPIRWYIIDMAKMSYVNTFNKSSKKKVKTADVILAQRGEAKKVRAELDLKDYVVRSYHERPGQKLELFVKRGHWETYMKAVKSGLVSGPTDIQKGSSVSDKRTRELRKAKKDG